VAVLGGELDVIPQSVQIPAVEIRELREQPNLATLATAASMTGT
jgi:hypothetical protein